MPATLREKLKKLRADAGYSLDELATLSGASKSYLWELENRDRRPSAEKLTDIARVLGVTTEYLIDEKAEFDESQLKETFFRRFNSLGDEDKTRIVEIMESWGKKK